MTTALTKPVTEVVYRINFAQLALITGWIVIVFLLKGLADSLSALAGGLAYWLPALIFSRSVVACAGSRATMRFMITFFIGEAAKLIVSGLFFLLAVHYFHIDLLYAVLGLAGAILAFWIASFTVLCQSGAKG